MTDRDDLLPKSNIPGLIPTLNNTGWMTESLDEISLAFTDYAGSIDAESLDIGCAYGIATLKALANGARILASDMEPRHLEILRQRAPADARDRLRVQSCSLPDIDFPANCFGAILASRVLHFLIGADVEKSVRKMHDWLVPGGRVFLVTDSPYTGPWKAAAPDYERRKAAGDPWPGYLDDYTRYLPDGWRMKKTGPAPINPMDPDILSRVCTEAGLEVIEARFLAGGTTHRTDRDHAGVIARKK